MQPPMHSTLASLALFETVVDVNQASRLDGVRCSNVHLWLGCGGYSETWLRRVAVSIFKHMRMMVRDHAYQAIVCAGGWSS